MNLQDEINAMIDAGAATSAPSTDAPKEEPVAEAEGELEVGKQDEEPKAEAAPAEEPEPEPPKIDELAKLKEETERLRKELEELRKPKEPDRPAELPKAQEAPPPRDMDFLGEEDLDDIVTEKEAFNKLLNKVYRQGVEAASKRIPQVDIANLVQENVSIALAMREANERFYQTHKDLQGFKKVVATVYGELASSNPSWTIEHALEETAKETRKRLELKPSETPKEKDKKPSLPPGSKGGKSSQAPAKKDRLQEEIEAMNASINT